MADASAIRLGENVNTSTNATELFLKKFAGEVLAKFQGKTVMDGKHLTRTIESGRSAQFPAVGGIDAEYHTPGAELTGLNVEHAERVINIDGLLLSHAFIANIDEAMNHYDVRSIYSNQMGNRLALKYDFNVLREIVKGARSNALVDSDDATPHGGTIIEDSNLGSSTDDTKAQALVDAIYNAAEALDEKDAPEDRFAVLKPAEYYLLVKNMQSNGFSAISSEIGGEGSFAAGNVMAIGGVTILKSNQVPTTDTSSDSYHGVNASTTKGVVFTPEAAGTVKLMDLATESEYDIRRQGHLMVAKMAEGHGWLRPNCCVEMRTAAV